MPPKKSATNGDAGEAGGVSAIDLAETLGPTFIGNSHGRVPTTTRYTSLFFQLTMKKASS
jgi:hypothetical protein